MKRILLVVLTVMFICANICPVMAQTNGQYDQEPSRKEPSLGMKIVDILFIRPACLIGSTASTGVYLAISPLLYVTGLAGPASRAMVEAPWRFTALRDPGQFSSYNDEKPATGVWDMTP